MQKKEKILSELYHGNIRPAEKEIVPNSEYKKAQLKLFSGMSWSEGAYTYDGKKHGLTLNGNLPEGVTVTKTNDSATNADNYTATAIFSLKTGYDAKNYEITGINPITKDWSIAPASLTGVKNLGASLRYTNTKAQTIKASDFGIKLPGSFALDSSVTDAGNVLSGVPTIGSDIVYQLAKDIVFNPAAPQQVKIPLIFTPTNTNYAPAKLALTVTLSDKDTVTLDLSADKSNNITYGDTVIYTATLDKDHAFLNALDALDGEVKFYLGDPKNGTLLDTKNVSSTTKSVSITLGFDKLTAGDHTVYAVYGGNTAFANATATNTTHVTAKILAWDVSGLSAVKSYDNNATATVDGKLLVSGALSGTDPGFTYTGLTGVYDSKDVGNRIVTVTVAGKKLTNTNYALPVGDLTFTGKINAVSDLTPPADNGGNKYKLEKEDGISTVPDTLKGNANLNTPAKIEAQMKVSITSANANIPSANIEVYDITLKFSTDGGKTWQVANESNFPSDGITVVLPYPTGTSRRGYDFVITHMFTTGAKTGTTETITPEKTADGLKFMLKSLSPVAVGYKAVTPSGGGNGGGGGSHEDRNNKQYDFWKNVENEVKSADYGDLIKVNAKSYDKMPVGVMDALRKNNVGMVINWDGGKTITIPSDRAHQSENSRIYYPLSLLAQMYKDIELVNNPSATDSAKENPQTGGFNYVDVTTGKTQPISGGIIEVAPPATIEKTTPDAPVTVTPSENGFEKDDFAKVVETNEGSTVNTAAIFAGIALLLAGMGGIYFLKKKKEDNI